MRSWKKRDDVILGNRKGFVRQAIRSGVPITPVVIGAPFGLTLELLPMHILLPAKIRVEIIDPIDISDDPDKENDTNYVDSIYQKVEQRQGSID